MNLYDVGQRSGRRGLLTVAIGAICYDPDMTGKRLLTILAKDVLERQGLSPRTLDVLATLGIDLTDYPAK